MEYDNSVISPLSFLTAGKLSFVQHVPGGQLDLTSHICNLHDKGSSVISSGVWCQLNYKQKHGH